MRRRGNKLLLGTIALLLMIVAEHEVTATNSAYNTYIGPPGPTGVTGGTGATGATGSSGAGVPTGTQEGQTTYYNGSAWVLLDGGARGADLDSFPPYPSSNDDEFENGTLSPNWIGIPSTGTSYVEDAGTPATWTLESATTNATYRFSTTTGNWFPDTLYTASGQFICTTTSNNCYQSTTLGESANGPSNSSGTFTDGTATATYESTPVSTWTATHSYAAGASLIFWPSGAVWINESGSPCTSGSGTQPAGLAQQVNPTSPVTDGGCSWVLAPLWTSDTVVTTSTWIYANGYVYNYTVGGTTTNGPVCNSGTCFDQGSYTTGLVNWTFKCTMGAWTAGNNYAANSCLDVSGNLWFSAAGGHSATGATPTQLSTPALNIKWDGAVNGVVNTNTSGPLWITGTYYQIGQPVCTLGTGVATDYCYVATTTGKAGASRPTCSSGTCSDGAVTWAYQYTSSTGEPPGIVDVTSRPGSLRVQAAISGAGSAPELWQALPPRNAYFVWMKIDYPKRPQYNAVTGDGQAYLALSDGRQGEQTLIVLDYDNPGGAGSYQLQFQGINNGAYTIGQFFWSASNTLSGTPPMVSYLGLSVAGGEVCFWYAGPDKAWQQPPPSTFQAGGTSYCAAQPGAPNYSYAYMQFGNTDATNPGVMVQSLEFFRIRPYSFLQP